VAVLVPARTAALALFVVGLAGCESPQDSAPVDVAPPPAEPASAERPEAPAGTESVDSTLSALQRAARAAREAELAQPKIEEQKLEPLQRARSGPTRIAPTALAEYIGSAVELQLKDGRAYSNPCAAASSRFSRRSAAAPCLSAYRSSRSRAQRYRSDQPAPRNRAGAVVRGTNLKIEIAPAARFGVNQRRRVFNVARQFPDAHLRSGRGRAPRGHDEHWKRNSIFY
jgi:hypothetical protein